jgi:hypothetical protein
MKSRLDFGGEQNVNSAVNNSYDSMLRAHRIRRLYLRGFLWQNLSWYPFVYAIVPGSRPD